jgi:hypothetical protein
LRRRLCRPYPSVPCHLQISKILEIGDVGDEYKLTRSDCQVIEKWEDFVQYFKSKNIKLPTFPIWTDVWDSTSSFAVEPKWKQKFIIQNRDFFNTHNEFLQTWLYSAREIEAFKGTRSKFEWQFVDATLSIPTLWNSRKARKLLACARRNGANRLRW